MKVLSVIGDPAATDELLSKLDDHLPAIKDSSGDEIPSYLLYHTEVDLTASLLEALGKVGNESVLPKINEYVKDGRPKVAGAARTAIEAIRARAGK